MRGNVKIESFLTVKLLPNLTSVTIFFLQLMVVFLNCCLMVVNLQKYFGKTFLPTLLESLQHWDGVEKKMKQNSFRVPILMNTFTRQMFLPVIGMAEWCSLHYVKCLVCVLISNIFVFILARKKWVSGVSLNCLFGLALLIKVVQTTISSFLDVWLSCFSCFTSCYLLLTSSMETKLFGRKNEKKKTNRSLVLKACANEEINNGHMETSGIGGRKLKLPLELEFAEENHNLDENISSLSLGPKDCDKERKLVTGSWFDNNLSSRSIEFNPNLEKPSLIWPAKFNLNGMSLHLRGQEQSNSEFSDEEPSPGSEMNDQRRDKNESGRTLKQNGDVLRTRTLSKHWHCNVLCLVLFISLVLNVVFLWLLKDTIRKAVFRL